MTRPASKTQICRHQSKENVATSVAQIEKRRGLGTSRPYELSFKTNPRKIGPVVSEIELAQAVQHQKRKYVVIKSR